MSYSEYSNSISYDDYQKLENETNKRIMNVIYKLYTLGCWIQGMHTVPPYGICFDIKCCVQDKEHISEDDKLRYKKGSQYLKDIFSKQLSYYLFDNVEYVDYIIDRNDLSRGIKAMLEG